MIVEIVNQVRNGIRCSAPTPEKYPHYVPTALEILDDAKRTYDLAQSRRELRAALQRIQRVTPGPDKLSMQAVIRGLDQVSDADIARMLPTALAKLKTLPMESRSIQLPVNISQQRGFGAGRKVTFIATTDGVDRHSSVILPMGIDVTRYQSNPIALFGHDGYGGGFSSPSPENVIGRTVALRRSEHELVADIEFLTADVNPRADMIFKMTKAGAISSVSIGFIPREVRQEMRDGKEIYVISKSELLEISVVPIPSQPNALVQGRD